MLRWTASVVVALLVAATASSAQEHLTEAKASFIFNGERIQISRGNPDAARFVAKFAAADGGCGAPCIAPMQAAVGVRTLDEIQVLDFLMTEVAGNTGLMVDARGPQARAQGFIPGTVSLPHHTVASGNPFQQDILRALGARAFDGVYNFTDARALLVYDGGPSSNDAGLLVQNLLDVGYPVEMIQYYRGGMQVWSVLGFSIESGQS
ncbi:MAG: rhodanese-like domain-containing protein [Sulfitobacter sp.]